MKLSIVIATYNAGKTLKQALDSIKYQTYTDIETIVVDGKSTDDTLDIIKEYSDVVTKWISEKDQGIYDAFNKGINMASGDYICFLGSDDCYCNYEVINKVANDLQIDMDVLSAPIFIIDDSNKLQMKMNNRISKEDLLSGKMIPHPGLFVKTSIMKKNLFNEENKIISDYEFLVRYILDGGKINFVNYPVVFFSSSGISSSGRGSKQWCRRLYEHILLINRLNLEDKYLQRTVCNLCEIKEKNISFFVKQIIKIPLEKLGLINKVKILLGKNNQHVCNLRYCRWCGRYGK